MHLAEISPDLKSFARKCSISRFSRVSSGFGEKTRQPTNRFRVLEAETRRRPDTSIRLAGSQAGSDGLDGWVGSRFLLDTPSYEYSFGTEGV